MIILGIDPGSRITGYGVIEYDGREQRLIAQGTIRVNTTDSHQIRLRSIYRELQAVMEAHLPDLCAVEMPVYGNNAQSMLKLGRAQAAAMLASLNRQIPIAEYTPKEVKKAVTGNGNATKDQVRYMIRAILQIDNDTTIALDASDALAVGICHLHRGEQDKRGTSGSWARFVRANPDRVR